MTIGDQIRTARIARGWSQQHLAATTRLNRNSIYRYEKNETMPRMPQAKRIFDALDIDQSGIHRTEQNPLSAYSNAELLAEIKRRMEG